jgi:membrane-bound lytic murein transglycosylase A
LLPLSFADLPGFADDDHAAAFALFARHAAAILDNRQPLRPALPADTALRAACRRALENPARTRGAARVFFEDHFTPYRVLRRVESGTAQGFVTGYYEPVIAGALTQTRPSNAPVLGRPDDLVTLAPGETARGLDPGLCAARLLADGGHAPYPDRAAIEAGAIADRAKPLVWLADKVEVFFVQVQGSARVSLADGGSLRLTYAGRNGHPYTSIGRALVEAGEIPAADMGMDRVKAWIRANGQAPGDAGTNLMLRNKSYVFFSQNTDIADANGPIGAAGLSLEPLRSIAIDRQIWSYGLPFWLAANLTWEGAAASPFRRLMIAGDTGSAILGPARADIFFGGGAGAGQFAGGIRHDCDVTVLLPNVLQEVQHREGGNR